MMDLTELKTPNIKISKKGKTYKVFEVSIAANSIMPPHFSTKEAVMVVQEGEAVLKIDHENNHLAKNDVCIIPAGTVHSLSIKNKFRSIVIMELDSEIEFLN